MALSIDKDTDLYCSFAEKAGSKGCKFHNAGFQALGINAIYKSFSVTNIKQALDAVRTLNIKGCAVTMPFKMAALELVDDTDEAASEIGATNTIINRNGKLTAYNTDWLAATEILQRLDKKQTIHILGNGGYSAAVRYAACKLGFNINKITRDEWHQIGDITDGIVYNCTPVMGIQLNSMVVFIDCIVTTPTGARLAEIQAKHQFKLYTGQKYPQC